VILVVVPIANINRRIYGAGKLWYLPAGTYTGQLANPAGTPYDPSPVGSKFTQGTDALTKVPGTTAALPLGITSEGMEFQSDMETDQDESAEYYQPHRIMMTGQSAKLSVELKTTNITNLRIASNVGTGGVLGGAGTATNAAIIGPVQADAVTRGQYLWESLDENVLLIIFSGLNTSGLRLAGKKGVEGSNLPLEIDCELPDATVAGWAYEIHLAGAALGAETVATD
jgi:hypothetical protein